jgi:hypothetical protein
MNFQPSLFKKSRFSNSKENKNIIFTRQDPKTTFSRSRGVLRKKKSYTGSRNIEQKKKKEGIHKLFLILEKYEPNYDQKTKISDNPSIVYKTSHSSLKQRVLSGFKQLLTSKVHLGHRVRQRNSKMNRFIHGERSGLHIIDLLQTLYYLNKVAKFLTKSTKKNKTFDYLIYRIDIVFKFLLSFIEIFVKVLLKIII